MVDKKLGKGRFGKVYLCKRVPPTRVGEGAQANQLVKQFTFLFVKITKWRCR